MAEEALITRMIAQVTRFKKFINKTPILASVLSLKCFKTPVNTGATYSNEALQLRFGAYLHTGFRRGSRCGTKLLPPRLGANELFRVPTT
jgi:hypothetical protein